MVCDDDADCGADSFCYHPADGTPPVCVAGATCTSDATCATGEACAQFSDGDGLVSQCVASFGTLEAGAACTVDGFVAVREFTCIDDAACNVVAGSTGYTCTVDAHVCVPPADQVCESGACVEGTRCGTSCTIDADCPTDMACVGSPALKNDQQDDDPANDEYVFGGACQIVTTTVCTSNTQCTAGGQVCKAVFERDGSGIEGRCGLTVPDAVQAGQPCGLVGDVDVPCAGICEIPANADVGTCRSLCAVDGDCTVGTCQAFDFAEGQDFADNLGHTLNVCK